MIGAFDSKGAEYATIAYQVENSLAEKIYLGWGFDIEHCEMWKRL